jgi:PAS domain S-box-containing protein
MAPVNKKIQRLLPWLLAMALFGLFVFLLLLGWAQAEQRWQQHWLAEQARVQASLLSSQHDLTQKARLLAQVISEDKAVITLVRKAYIVHEQEGGNGGAALSQQLRTQLNAHLQPYWRHMEPAGVRQLNIHFGPSGTVFLRVQKPERFGDNTALFRPMVLQLLRQSEPVTGMEVGRFGSGYRALQPISPNDTNTNNHDNDNKVNDGVAIAAIEVGVALLPITPFTGDIKKRPKQPPPEQAVMLHPSLINNVLWDDARTQVQGNISTNSAVVHKQWGLESFTHPLIKEWLAKELLPTQLGELEQPWLLHYEDQDYLLCVSRPQYFSEQHALKNVAQVVVLNWQNVTPEFVAKKAERMSLASQYFAVLILAEAMLMLWFYYNHLQQEHIQRLGDQQLQQEQALTGQLQQQLSLLMEHTASGYWDWNISTNRAHLSKEWREFCGLPANNGGDTDIEEWLDLIHPSDKRASYAEMIRHIKGETPQLESEYRLRIADGSYKWVSTRGKVVEWLPNGRALLIKGIYTNITQRKNNEIAVVRQEAALTILSEIVSALEANAETQLHQALGMGARFLGLQSGAISAINGQQYQVILENQLTAQHPVSLTNTSTNVHLAYATDALSNHLCELTYQRKTVFACDHISLSEYRERQANPYKKIESYLGEPLWLNGEIYGTLSFVSEHIRHQPYDDVDKNFIRALARWVEATLLRWQQQKEQQVTLDRFNKLSENLPGFVFQFQLHPDGKSLFPYVSAGISAIYNLSADEVKHNATTLFNRIHKDDLGWISEAMSTSATKLTPWIATFRVHHRQQYPVAWLSA